MKVARRYIAYTEYTVISLGANSVSGKLVTVLFSSEDQILLQGGNHASPKTKISSVLFHN